ncbi:MAG: S-layer homology domain-containing protein [Clostridiales bacterium]|nr:S-layer homology domain-containing protein [Clostridiales bacterium]
MRKGLAPALILALLILVPGQGALAQEGTAVLRDIKGHWAEGYIVTLVERGIVRGYEDQTFRPDKPISRAEFVTLLVRELKPQVEVPSPPAFDDVARSHWAYEAIQKAAAAGWLQPAEYGRIFKADLPMGRGEAARLIVRAMGLAPEAAALTGISGTFSDVQGEIKPYVDVAVAHGLLTGFPGGVFKPQGTLTRAEAGVIILRLTDPSLRPATWTETYTFKITSRTNKVQVVRVNLNRPDIEVKPVIAKGQIGQTESLMDMANRVGAMAAINGTYFAAYKDRYGDRFGEPFGTLVIDGRWLHLTYQGTTLAITSDKKVLMAPLEMEIEGSVDGHEGFWGAFHINATIDDLMVLYTKEWGPTTRRDKGATVTVENGRVTAIGGPDVPIPQNGYVVWFPEKYAQPDQWSWKNLARVGAKVDWKVKFRTHDLQPFDDPAWRDVVQAIGVGPRLVAGGKVVATPESMAKEKFTESKIVSDPYNRSGVGVTRDGILIFAVTNYATMAEWAEIMRQLGAVEAMAMDSGASSGLIYQGKYLWQPGRELSNALVVLQKK